MEGYPDPADKRGIIPNSFKHIFDAIAANANPTKQFLVRASYLEIYQEVRAAARPRWKAGAHAAGGVLPASADADHPSPPALPPALNHHSPPPAPPHPAPPTPTPRRTSATC